MTTFGPVIVCPECGERMKLKPSKFGLFYGCVNFPKCNATHGAHPNGKPLGVPANAETKMWRMKAHAALKGRTQSMGLNRREAYRWLRETTGLASKDAHIAMFDIDKCKQLVEICLLEGEP